MGLRDELYRLFNSGQLEDRLKREETEFLGQKVWVWELGGDDRDAFEESRYEQANGNLRLDLKGTRAKLVMLSVRDSGERGARRSFIDGDEKVLGSVAASELDQVYSIAVRLSRMQRDVEKKSGVQSDDSSSASPENSNGQASPGVLAIFPPAS